MNAPLILAGGVDGRSRLLPVADASQVNEARREATAIAQALGFPETEAYEVQLVASEMATNLALHAGGGDLLVRPIPGGIELVAVDRGPGIEDVGKAQRDGYSTAGTAGNGLGAIKRLCAVFDIHSVPRKGTVVLGQLLAGHAAPGRGAPRLGAVCLPYPGERECGDAWAVAGAPGALRVAVVDGLGHGPSAAQAADAALAAFLTAPERPPSDIIERVHGAIRHTRGAAMAVCGFERNGVARFSGVGNIAGVLVDGPALRSMVSSNGILGAQVHKVQDFSYPRGPEALLVMHSDGVGTRWRLEDYPGLAARHPGLVAATLWRDFARGRDDATVVVVGGG